MPPSLALSSSASLGYVVDGQLHLFVVADIRLRDQVFDLAHTDPRPDTQLAIISFEMLARSLRRPSQSISSWRRSST
jgi:hypothetical protein